MKTLRTALFVAVGLGSSSLVSANAFNINEHDAKASGRGGATAASNTDPSSIVFNPGGIAVNQGTAVALNGSLYIAQGSYERADGTMKTETDSDPSPVPAIYITSRVHDMVAVGIGLHLPFGLAISWPDQHEQAGVIQDQSLRTYFITPSVGINLDKQVPGLSIGGGVDIVPATVQLERELQFGETTGTAVLGGEAVGVGGRLGVMYRSPDAPVKLGVMWRSKVKLDFEGQSDFDIDAPYREQLPPDGDITTSITLPQAVWGGVAYSPIPALELEANAVWIGWSSFNELRINLPEDNVTVQPQEYEDTVTFRFGAEYQLAAQKAAIRAGFVYDPSPIPTTTLGPSLPDIDRKNVSLGASKWFGNGYGAHLGFLWVTPGERETSDEMPYNPQYKGTYGVQAFVTSLMFSGQFGQ